MRREGRRERERAIGSNDKKDKNSSLAERLKRNFC